MANLQTLVACLVALACSAGLVGVACCRHGPCPIRIRWGQRIFLLTLALLGTVSLVTAWHVHRGVIYVGLATCLLLLAMLWEAPRRPALSRDSSW